MKVRIETRRTLPGRPWITAQRPYRATVLGAGGAVVHVTGWCAERDTAMGCAMDWIRQQTVKESAP